MSCTGSKDEEVPSSRRLEEGVVEELQSNRACYKEEVEVVSCTGSTDEEVPSSRRLEEGEVEEVQSNRACYNFKEEVEVVSTMRSMDEEVPSDRRLEEGEVEEVQSNRACYKEEAGVVSCTGSMDEEVPSSRRLEEGEVEEVQSNRACYKEEVGVVSCMGSMDKDVPSSRRLEEGDVEEVRSNRVCYKEEVEVVNSMGSKDEEDPSSRKLEREVEVVRSTEVRVVKEGRAEETIPEVPSSNNKDEDPYVTVRGGKEEDDVSKPQELNGIKCYYTNADGMMNKRKEIEVFIELYKPEIIGIVESGCNKEVLDSEISFNGYKLFRKDKEHGDGRKGGALLYIHQSLKAVQSYKFDELSMESSIWYEVELSDNENLLVGLVYRSPNSTSENNEALRKQLLHTATLNHINNMLVFGDFNFREINWKHNTVSAGLNSEPQAFMDVIQDLLLVQHVEEFTRSREGQRPSLLDCVFTNDENSIDEIVHRPAVGKSDHDCLTWTYLCRAQTIQSRKEKLNYNKGDYNAMKSQFANTDWKGKIDDLSCNAAWEVFQTEYKQAVDKHVPLKKIKTNKKPLWMKAGVKKSVKKKHHLYMKYRQTMRYKDYL